jgi:hypothetical protein
MNIVVFCKYRKRRMAQGSERKENGVILPGGIRACTNPSGHCSCVSTCGINKSTAQGSGRRAQGVSNGSIDRRNSERSGILSLQTL